MTLLSVETQKKLEEMMALHKMVPPTPWHFHEQSGIIFSPVSEDEVLLVPDYPYQDFVLNYTLLATFYAPGLAQKVIELSQKWERAIQLHPELENILED